MDLECDPGSRDDNLLDAVDVTKHPLVIHSIRASVSEEHTVETVHKVVISVKGMLDYHDSWLLLPLSMKTMLAARLTLSFLRHAGHVGKTFFFRVLNRQNTSPQETTLGHSPPTYMPTHTHYYINVQRLLFTYAGII